MGQRLTGWVAANKQTIVNSDAALDLGNLTMHLDPMPLACLSTPMCQDADLVGVVTIYSTRRQPFTDAHVPVVEVIARGLANLIPPSTVATPPKPLAVRIADTPLGIRVH